MTSTPPGPHPRPASAGDGLRFALGTLTVLPVRVTRWDRQAARHGMVCAPVAGLAVGLLAALAATVFFALGAAPTLTAVVAVAVPAVLTRGLHLDGLADVADGLGSGKPAREALAVMKQSDIGPFAVITLLFVLLGQVAAVKELYERDGWAQGAIGVIVAAVTARAALTLAAREGVGAARPGGLGATVAGTVPVGAAYAVAAAVAVLAALAGAGTDPAAHVPYSPGGAGLLADAVRYGLAAVLGLAVSELLLLHCRGRLGGVTGDVFGALAEAAVTAALVVLALG
jgi:adenosylcobinamide-GDP ribazoletransferase